MAVEETKSYSACWKLVAEQVNKMKQKKKNTHTKSPYDQHGPCGLLDWHPLKNKTDDK